MKRKLLLLCFTLLSVLVKAQNNSIENRIIDTILKLKEVKERAEYVEKVTNGKRHLGICIYKNPSKDQPYYWVKAWEDNGSNYVTHFNFYVYRRPFQIKFLDTVEDTVISLKEWRRRMKNKISH